MSDLIKGVLGGAWAAAVGWILPVFIVLHAGALVVVPAMSLHAMRHFREWPIEQQQLVLLTAAVALGLGFASIQTPLYGVLEGYLLWPQAIKKRRTERHIELRRVLFAAAEGECPAPTHWWRPQFARLRATDWNGKGSSAPEGQGKLGSADQHNPGLEQGLRWSRARYPADEGQVAPTALGNAIRRFETYASDRYQMDSQLLFHHLAAKIPDSVAQAQERARINVDFAVCLTWTSTIATVVSLITWLTAVSTISLLFFAAGGSITAVLAYWLAVLGTDEWEATMRAQVDLGRAGVAAAFGLRIPENLADERRMWSYVNLFVRGPYAEIGTAADWLSHFRSFGRDAADEAHPVRSQKCASPVSRSGDGQGYSYSSGSSGT